MRGDFAWTYGASRSVDAASITLSTFTLARSSGAGRLDMAVYAESSRLRPVRLTDLQPWVLRQAALVACKHEPDEVERRRIAEAARNPSDKTYLIAA
jgi:hypothetical protein